MGKLLLVLVGIAALAAVGFLVLGGAVMLPGGNGSSCSAPSVPAGAVAWFDTTVVLERSGGDWIATIEQDDPQPISAYTPHCVPPMEDRVQDFPGGGNTVGTWTLSGAIRTTDQNNGASTISTFSVNGFRFESGASNIGGQLILHAPTTFFLSHTHYRTTSTIALAFDNGIQAEEENDISQTMIEGSS